MTGILSRRVFTNHFLSRHQFRQLTEGRRVSDLDAKLLRSKSTLNSEEVAKFGSYENLWWKKDGPCKPLHALNALRIRLIRNGLVNAGVLDASKSRDHDLFKNISFLDVGCGGGVLSEALARLGGHVVGLDVTESNVEVAKCHAEKSGLNIDYCCSPIESYEENRMFDVVVASEVIEHVDNNEQFLEECVKRIRVGGSIFLTTINRTREAYLAAIIGAEHILGLLPRGTHDYNKFVSPSELQSMLSRQSCSTRLVHGLFYWPLSNKWSFIPFANVNYALHAVKTK